MASVFPTPRLLREHAGDPRSPTIAWSSAGATAREALDFETGRDSTRFTLGDSMHRPRHNGAPRLHEIECEPYAFS